MWAPSISHIEETPARTCGPLTSVAQDKTHVPRRHLVGVFSSGSPRGILRRVVMSRDSPSSECVGARNTMI